MPTAATCTTMTTTRLPGSAYWNSAAAAAAVPHHHHSGRMIMAEPLVVVPTGYYSACCQSSHVSDRYTLVLIPQQQPQQQQQQQPQDADSSENNYNNYTQTNAARRTATAASTMTTTPSFVGSGPPICTSSTTTTTNPLDCLAWAATAQPFLRVDDQEPDHDDDDVVVTCHDDGLNQKKKPKIWHASSTPGIITSNGTTRTPAMVVRSNRENQNDSVFAPFPKDEAVAAAAVTSSSCADADAVTREERAAETRAFPSPSAVEELLAGHHPTSGTDTSPNENDDEDQPCSLCCCCGAVGGGGNRAMPPSPSATRTPPRRLSKMARTCPPRTSASSTDRSRYLTAVRMVLLYLKRTDPIRHQRAKDVLNDCLARLRRSEPGYAPLTIAQLNRRFADVLYEQDWRRARLYFRKQRQEQEQQQQTSKTTTPAVSSSSSNSSTSIPLIRILNQLQRQQFFQHRARQEQDDGFFLVRPPAWQQEGVTPMSTVPTRSLQDEFVAACWQGDTDSVRRMTSSGLDLNRANQHGKTGLLAACRRRHNEVVKFLLQQPNLDLTVRDDEDSRTVLEIAVAENCPLIVRSLVLRQSPTVHAMIPNVLHTACRQGRLESLVYLANSNGATPIDWNCYNDEGLTPLQVAVVARQPLVVAFLVMLPNNNQVDVNARSTTTGDTALHLACRQGCVATTQVLLRHARTNRSARNQAQQTPLDVQPSWTSWDTVQGLKDTQHDFRQGLVRYLWAREEALKLPTRGGGPWHAVCKQPKFLDILVYLAVTHPPPMCGRAAGNGNSWNHSNYRRWTTLHTAVKHGSASLVAFLLATNRVDVNACNREGDTALMVACQRQDSDLIYLLLSHSQTEWSIRNKMGLSAWEKFPSRHAAALRDYAVQVHSTRLLQSLDTVCKDMEGAAVIQDKRTAAAAADRLDQGSADVTGKVLGVLSEWLRVQILPPSTQPSTTSSSRGQKRKRIVTSEF